MRVLWQRHIGRPPTPHPPLHLLPVFPLLPATRVLLPLHHTPKDTALPAGAPRPEGPPADPPAPALRVLSAVSAPKQKGKKTRLTAHVLGVVEEHACEGEGAPPPQPLVHRRGALGQAESFFGQENGSSHFSSQQSGFALSLQHRRRHLGQQHHSSLRSVFFSFFAHLLKTWRISLSLNAPLSPCE